VQGWHGYNPRFFFLKEAGVDYLRMIESMTPDIYRNLKQAVEIGKWPDGTVLSAQQREDALQAIIAWGEKHLPAGERVGYIDKGHKGGDLCDDPGPEPLNWKQ
jgi:uncharacterized protein YeaC (DUF1315 family)